jgi:hypothetical protein
LDRDTDFSLLIWFGIVAITAGQYDAVAAQRLMLPGLMAPFLTLHEKARLPQIRAKFSQLSRHLGLPWISIRRPQLTQGQTLVIAGSRC